MSKFASLTAGLLARKGEAEPTSTPFADQLLTRVGAPASDIRALTPMHSHVHTHVEPGAFPKEEGLKLHTAKPNETFTSVFGTFGRRAVQEAAARQHHQKLDGIEYTRSPRGLPLLADALMWLECEAEAYTPAGDHVLVLGRVLDGRVQHSAEPMTTAYTGWAYSG